MSCVNEFCFKPLSFRSVVTQRKLTCKDDCDKEKQKTAELNGMSLKEVFSIEITTVGSKGLETRCAIFDGIFPTPYVGH